MSDKIKLLPEVVANQIAAGEVVNRPASVVKEMMENAIDAGATEVKVNFRDGGRDLIQIVDNGSGMSPIDARMAFDRHATSKIASVEDIYALSTFGFRGEALASIAAVAQVELRTRRAEDEVGTQTEINGGQFAGQTPVMCPVGAQFCVRNLFYNVPARRRFLDKSTTSAGQIKSEFQRVALCNPQVAFELYSNDAPIYTLPSASLAGRIVDVVGRHIKQNLLEVSADTSIAHVEGFIGRPAAAKRRNSEQYLFVNGRYFKSPYLTSAILKAYDKLIGENVTPSYFLYLEIDPSRIDVNVHPQKTEVKFADEQAVWQIVNAAVRETLAKTGAVPMMDFDRESAVEIPVLNKGAVYGEPRAMSNTEYNPFNEEYIDPSAPDPNVDFAGFDVPYTGEPQQVADASESRYTFKESGKTRSSRADLPGGLRSAGSRRFLQTAADEDEFLIPSADDDSFRDFISGEVTEVDVPEDEGHSELEFISSDVGEQQRLDVGGHPEFTEPISLGGGYLAALLNSRFVVVDVRRARERIFYEDYLKMLGSGSAVSQQLLFPERLVLSKDEYALLEENAVEFAALGFDLDYCGDCAVEVRGTPADLSAEGIDQLIYELLQAFSTPVSLTDLRREKVAALMARSSSRGVVRALSREECEMLLSQLVASGNFNFSPSGKAIIAEITPEDIRTMLG